MNLFHEHIFSFYNRVPPYKTGRMWKSPVNSQISNLIITNYYPILSLRFLEHNLHFTIRIRRWGPYTGQSRGTDSNQRKIWSVSWFDNFKKKSLWPRVATKMTVMKYQNDRCSKWLLSKMTVNLSPKWPLHQNDHYFTLKWPLFRTKWPLFCTKWPLFFVF